MKAHTKTSMGQFCCEPQNALKNKVYKKYGQNILMLRANAIEVEGAEREGREGCGGVS